MDMRFRAAEAAKLIDSNAVDVARLGQIITPDVPANGKGYRSLYSFRNLVEMRISEYLAQFGVPYKRIQKYIKDLQNTRGKWLEEKGPEGVILLDNFWRWSAGSTVTVAWQALEVQGLKPTGAIVIDLGIIKGGIRQRMAESERAMPVTEGEINDG